MIEWSKFQNYEIGFNAFDFFAEEGEIEDSSEDESYEYEDKIPQETLDLLGWF